MTVQPFSATAPVKALRGSATDPSVTFTGDTNTGIYSPGADQVAISTNGTGRLFVDASGNVGIGTPPSSLLQLQANSNNDQSVYLRNSNTGSSASSTFSANTSTAEFVMRAHSASHSVWPATATITANSGFTNGLALNTGTTAPIAFYINNSERMKLDSSGRLGLGTSSPNSLLETKGTSSGGEIEGLRLTNSSTATNTSSSIIFNLSTASATSAKIAAVRTNSPVSSDTELVFSQLSNGTLTERLRIDSSGNVGVGTTSPQQKLSVSTGSDSDAGSISISLGAVSNGSSRKALITKNTASPYEVTVATSDGGSSGALIFKRSSTEESARIDSSGRLLVGTSSARVNVAGFTPSLQIEGTNSSTSSLSLVNNQNNTAGSYIFFSKSRGTTVGATTIVASGDAIGGLYFSGADGTDLQTAAASIDCVVDGTPGANDMPGRLVFSTTADSASSPTERLRITSTGQVNISSSGSAASPALVVGGDTNTGIYSPGADQVAISTSGQGRLFVDSSGNVGVGTSLTTFYGGRFTVLGGALALASGNKTIFWSPGDNGTGEILSPAQNVLAFNTNSTERLRITSDGNVGLGTSSPGGKAHIAHTAGLPVTSGSTQTHGALRFGASGTNGVLDIGNAGASGSWLQATNQTSLIPGNSFPLLLNPNGGNVGVGTTSPGTALDVRGTSGSVLNIQGSSVAGNSIIATFKTGSNSRGLEVYGNYTTEDWSITNYYNSSLSFGTNNTERLRITSTGQVNISSSGSAASPALVVGGDTNTGIYSPGADQVAISTNGTGRLFVDASGNVGVKYAPSAGIASYLQIGYAGIGSDHVLYNYDSYFANNLFKSGNAAWNRISARAGGLLRIDDAVLTYSTANSGTAGASASLSECLRITSDGKLGLGTSSPAVPLNISSSANGTPATSGTTQTHGSFRIASSATTGCIDFGPNGSNPWIQATDRTDLSQTYNLLLNPNGGNVGVGTTSPAFKLHAYDGTGPSIAGVFETNQSESYISFKASGTTSASTVRIGAIGNDLITVIDSSEKMRVDSSGRLGLGASTAPAGLDARMWIDQAGTNDYGLLINASGGVKQPTLFFRDASATLNGKIVGQTGLTLATGSSGTAALTIDGSQRVGVGTTSPTQLLSLAGSSANILLAGTSNSYTTYNINASNVGYVGDANWIFGGLSSDFGVRATNNLVFGIGANEHARIDSSGRLGIGTTSVNTTLEVLNSSTPIIRVGDGTRHMELRGGSTGQNAAIGTNYAGGFDIIQNGGAAVTIDTSKRVLVGTSSARSNFFNSTNSAANQIEGASNDGATLAIIQNFNGASNGAVLILAKSNGSSVGSNTIIANTNIVGQLSFQGNDGTEFTEAASIRAEVDGTPGANDMPGRLVFSTTADSASSPTERLRITSTGQVNISSSGSAASPALVVGGDTNTGIYSPGADQVAISTNGTGRLFVDASGNVGISEATPGSYSIGAGAPTLVFKGTSVSTRSGGTVFVTQDGTSGKTYLYHDAGLFRIQSETATAIRLDTNNTERLRITATGELKHIGGGTEGDPAVYFAGSAPAKSLYVEATTGHVGLGTSSPQSLLSVAKAAEGTALEAIRVVNESPNQRSSSSVYIGMYGSNEAYERARILCGNPTDFDGNNGFLSFWTRNANTLAEKVRIDNTGRVGVGTTSPQGIFETSTSSPSNVFLTSTGGNSNLRIVSQDGGLSSLFFGDTSDPQTGGIAFDHSDNSLQLIGHNYAERARIDSSGRLLVGTSSSTNAPSGCKLVVNTNSASARLESTGGYGLDFVYPSVPTTGGDLGYVGFKSYTVGTTEAFGAWIIGEADGNWATGSAPTRLVFSTTADGASAPTERMRIGNDGFVNAYVDGNDGLQVRNSASAGTSTACFAARHSATSVADGILSFIVWSNGNVVNTNNSYGAISDIKLKENIVDANSQWSDIKALQVRNYNFKEGQTHTQLGLIAQEVELVSPGLVSESPDRDEGGNDLGTVTKSVNYSVLYMKAVKALQEAMERIETLEAKVAALESA